MAVAGSNSAIARSRVDNTDPGNNPDDRSQSITASTEEPMHPDLPHPDLGLTEDASFM